MRFGVLLICAAIVGCASAGKARVTHEALLGKWRCGPTAMKGPGFNLVVTTETENLADHTYTTLTTGVITPDGKPPITNKDLASGTWRIDGDIVTVKVDRVQFLSSTDPTLSQEAGQGLQDAQIRKKSIYQSQILELTDRRSRSIPVNSMYKEALVESSCERV